jgi:DNA repair protein SbcC/Rad50
MRPVRLTVQAFGPYAEREVIDFRQAVEARLFGIYGQTGSGKSTIFSAMTFALFGQSSKEEQEAPSLRSDHADTSLLTEVEFVFDMGARRYVVLRHPEQMRPKQRGGGETKSQHEAFLFDATGLALDEITETQRGKIVVEKKVSAVDAAIKDLLGYGPEQFRQIVLLPQGRFEKFLSAKTKERLEILRDLFDVSLFRALATKLKADADAAERLVREEREVCVGRLSAEGFESKDALSTGIADADTRHLELQKEEKSAREASEAATSAVQQANAIETQFKAAEAAKGELARLDAGTPEMDALADRVARAERARSLLDIEVAATGAENEVRGADKALKLAQGAANDATLKEKAAAEALRKETERSGEIEDLRRRVDEFDRHTQTLEKAEENKGVVAKAQTAEREAASKVEAVQVRLTDLQAQSRAKVEALKSKRQSEAQRQEIATRLVTLKPTLAAAEAFEKAEEDVLSARAQVERLTSEFKTAKNTADGAQLAFEEAERNLSTVQALHLASKLSAEAPCPVCGATEHPSPATGAIENIGLDQAFRYAKDAWQSADRAARDAGQKLAGAQSVLKERQDRFASLDRPEGSATVIRSKLLAEQKALEHLGPKIDITAAEVEIERLNAEAQTLEKERDTLAATHLDRQRTTVAERAALSAVLGSVPEVLREPAALAAAKERAAKMLAERQGAKEEAEKTASNTRDAALAARIGFQAAEKTLSSCQERQRKAIEALQIRLQQARLSEDDFRSLKPAIGMIETDRAAVEEHRRKLENAKEIACVTLEAIREQVRPDLTALDITRQEAAKRLISSTDLRSGAWHRLQQLTKLRDDLFERWHKLDEAEVASGTLRNLAKLANGENQQKLDIETFAIGAMFDHVLDAANLRLGPMTAHRYRLERDIEGTGRGRRGLGIEVFDVHTGKARPTSTLSGGETFIAALSLALGLADVVENASGKIRLDTIFIDEGFGSLDTENGAGTLDQVLQALSSLVSQNRSVGLISHVALVQEAIPNGFYVRKHLSGSSVETRGVL